MIIVLTLRIVSDLYLFFLFKFTLEILDSFTFSDLKIIKEVAAMEKSFLAVQVFLGEKSNPD